MSNIKPFFGLYNWMGIENPTVLNNNSTLFENYNPGIALIVFYINVNIETV